MQGGGGGTCSKMRGRGTCSKMRGWGTCSKMRGWGIHSKMRGWGICSKKLSIRTNTPYLHATMSPGCWRDLESPVGPRCLGKETAGAERGRRGREEGKGKIRNSTELQCGQTYAYTYTHHTQHANHTYTHTLSLPMREESSLMQL